MQNICTKTLRLARRPVIQIHCTSSQQIDAIWRLLSRVPDEYFVEAEIWLSGEFHYLVIRTADGEQTAAPAAGQPA
jgi:hypothetical protein